MVEDRAIFAGGCFWCIEAAFADHKGVTKVTSGYTGDKTSNPTYQQISTGETDHYEAVLLEYNASEISYDQLLNIFWQNIDPFDKEGQFYDKGSQYKTAIFYYNDSQRSIAEASKNKYQQNFGNQIMTTAILPAKIFYPAEEYHQNYHKTNAVHYKTYKQNSGREEKLKAIWNHQMETK